MSPQPVTAGLLAPFAAGLGFQDYIFPVTPSAGATSSFTVPGEFSMRVLAANLSITTSAAAANRFIALDYLHPNGAVLVRNGAGLVVTASTTGQVFNWNFERTVAEWAANTPVLAPCLAMDLQPGFVVRFSVDNIQAADQISSLSLVVEKFETGDRGYPRGVTTDFD